MNSFFSDDVARVSLFDLSHIVYLSVVIIVTVIFVLKLDYVKERKEWFRKIFIGISLVQVLVFYTWSGVVLGFGLEAGLPIHLCRTSTFLGLYFLITEDKRVFHALFYTSAFALIAIFYPVGVHPIYTHIVGYSYQISHLMIILVWILGVFVYGYRPTRQILTKAAGWFMIVLVYVGAFNYLVGEGEYLYLRGDVNRPFFKDMPDLIWVGGVFIVAYLVMFVMTRLLEEKKLKQEQ